MKVLFLDIDGVINNEAAFIKENEAFRAGKPSCTPFVIDYFCRNELLRVLEATGAKIVLSSTWRLSYESINRLLQAGVISRETMHSDPATRYLISAKRGHEIQDWLRRNPVDHYAIVDDDSDMLDEQMSFFVKTSFQNGGLTREHGNKLIAILNAVHETNDNGRPRTP